MGSFNITCAVSNLTIDYDTPFIRIFLVPTWISRSWVKKNPEGEINLNDRNDLGTQGSLDFYRTQSCAVSNEGAYAMYTPFGFPVHYKYDDYGDGELVDNEENLKQIKQAAKLADCQSRLAYCDILTPVYEYLAAPFVGKLDFDDDYYNKFIIETKHNLKKLIQEAPKKKADHETFLKHLQEKGDIKNFDYFKERGDPFESFYFSNVRAIPQLCKDNFLQIFVKNGLWNADTDYDKLDELMRFTWRVGRARLILRPSHYGGQDDNHKLIYNINKIAKKAIVDRKKTRGW